MDFNYALWRYYPISALEPINYSSGEKSQSCFMGNILYSGQEGLQPYKPFHTHWLVRTGSAINQNKPNYKASDYLCRCVFLCATAVVLKSCEQISLIPYLYIVSYGLQEADL